MKIYLKHEWEQATGSFKERGARNSLLALDPEQKKKGVVAASAGNHALALAYHGRELGIPVTVLMPSIAPLTKITKCRALEANVVLEGDTIADAALAARSYVENDGMKYINGFDDFNIISAPARSASRFSRTLRTSTPSSCLWEAAASSRVSRSRSRPSTPRFRSSASSPIDARPWRRRWQRDRLSRFRRRRRSPTASPCPPSDRARSKCSDQGSISSSPCPRRTSLSRSFAWLRLRSSSRRAQAPRESPRLAGKLPELEGKNVAVLLCGGNIDTSTLGNVLERGLVNDGRLIRFSAVVPDRPGGIAGLCAVIAFVGASIKQIVHERAWLQEDSHAVQVDVTCELTGDEMKEALYKALSEKYAVDFSLSKSKLNMGMVGKDSAGMMAAESTNGATAKTYSFDKNKNGAKPGRLPAPVLYDYDTIINNVKPSAELVAAVEDAFSQLANGRVDVPLPMHIGIAETPRLDPVTATSRAGTSRARDVDCEAGQRELLQQCEEGSACGFGRVRGV